MADPQRKRSIIAICLWAPFLVTHAAGIVFAEDPLSHVMWLLGFALAVTVGFGLEGGGRSDG